MADKTPNSANDSRSPVATFGNVCSIAGFIVAIAAPIIDRFWGLTEMTEATIYVIGLMLMTLGVMVWCQFWAHEIYKQKRGLIEELTDTRSDHASEVTILQKEMVEYERRSDQNLILQRMMYEVSHTINDKLRDLDHLLIEHRTCEEEAAEDPDVKTYFNRVLSELVRYYKEKTNGHCSVAVKTCYKAKYEGGKTYGVSAFMRDYDSKGDYYDYDTRFPTHEQTDTCFTNGCYEYSSILHDKNGLNYCIIPDVRKLVDKEGKNKYYHQLKPIEEIPTFVSKLVVPIGYKGLKYNEVAAGMEKLYGFIEIECSNEGLTKKDFHFLASVADRLYISFRLQEISTA